MFHHSIPHPHHHILQLALKNHDYTQHSNPTYNTHDIFSQFIISKWKSSTIPNPHFNFATIPRIWHSMSWYRNTKNPDIVYPEIYIYYIYMGKLQRPHCSPSLEIMVSKGHHPQMAQLFRLVKYYNLPRYIIPYGSKHLLRRYLTPQIMSQTLPKKVLGSIGINKHWVFIPPSSPSPSPGSWARQRSRCARPRPSPRWRRAARSSCCAAPGWRWCWAPRPRPGRCASPRGPWRNGRRPDPGHKMKNGWEKDGKYGRFGDFDRIGIWKWFCT